MKQSTSDKLKAMFAAQQTKTAAINSKPLSNKTGEEKKATPQATRPASLPVTPAPEVKPQPKRNAEKCPLKLFTILFHETGEDTQKNVGGRTATNWRNASYLLSLINCPADGLTYYKTDVLIEWKDGTTFKGRLDIGYRDYNPTTGQSVGEYLKIKGSSILGRLFTPEICEQLQFEDEPEALKRKDTAPDAQKPGKISVIMPEDNKPPQIVEMPATQPETAQEVEFEETPLTFADLLAGKTGKDTIDIEDLAPGDIEEEKFNTQQQPAPAKPYTAPKPPATPAAQEINLPSLELVRYSDKSLAIFGKRTKELRQEIRDLGGKFNAILNYKDTGTRQAGWIFFYTPDKEEELKQFIEFFS